MAILCDHNVGSCMSLLPRDMTEWFRGIVLDRNLFWFCDRLQTTGADAQIQSLSGAALHRHLLS